MAGADDEPRPENRPRYSGGPREGGFAKKPGTFVGEQISIEGHAYAELYPGSDQYLEHVANHIYEWDGTEWKHIRADKPS